MRWKRRTVVAVLLAVSGVLYAAAAAERWWPACRFGHFDEPACVQVQDHAYDHLVPAAPWILIGDAAQLVGLALMGLAIAVALLPWLWLPRRTGASVAAAVPAVAIGMMGVASWTAGSTGEPAALPGGPMPFLLWSVGLPLTLLAATATGSEQAPPRTLRWRLLVVLLIAMANPLVAVFVGPLLVGYMSHDSTPWIEAVTAGFLIAASIVVWPSTQARASAPARTDDASLSRS